MWVNDNGGTETTMTSDAVLERFSRSLAEKQIFLRENRSRNSFTAYNDKRMYLLSKIVEYR